MTAWWVVGCLNACGPNRERLALARFYAGESIRTYHLGRYDEALRHARAAVDIDEAELAADAPELAVHLHNLASVHLAMGALDQAEICWQRALRIQRDALGDDDVRTATTMNGLAQLYLATGAWDRALPLLRVALGTFSRHRGAAHPDVALVQGNLASAYLALDEFHEAEPLCAAVVRALDGVGRRGSTEMATALDAHASALRGLGEPDGALALQREALAIRLRVQGELHADTAATYNNLARTYVRLGERANAATLFTRALSIYNRVLGHDHPDVASSLGDLASVLATDDLDHAVGLLREATEISERIFRRVRLVTTEARVSAMLAADRRRETAVYALLLRHPGHAGLRQLALALNLLRKGRSIDEVAAMSLAVRRGLPDEDQERFEALRELRARLATAALSSDTERRSEIPSLEQACERVEQELVHRSTRFRARWELPTVGDVLPRVAAALPRDAVLVEYVTLHPQRAPSAVGSAEEPERMLALVLEPRGDSLAVDLGPVGPIEASVRDLLRVVTRPGTAWQGEAREVYRRVLAPVASSLGGRTRVYLAPDGVLNLVPFEALDDGRGVMNERFEVTVLTSGRDLLRPVETSRGSRSSALFADPDFGGRSWGLRGSRGVVRGELPPIPGTRREVEALWTLLPEARVFVGAEATEETLLAVEAPDVLHVATHGIFLEGGTTDADARNRGVSVVADGTPLRPGTTLRLTVDDNSGPLTRSALVMAGAARGRTDGAGDGLATALEVAGMNLWGTQLVVLSACDTGRGEVRVGDGVHGLRRAVLVAGAETLVASLWHVDDAATRELMVAFYRRLLAGEGRAKSLREASLEVRRHAAWSHPYYWAPFVLSGRAGPLVVGETHPTRGQP